MASETAGFIFEDDSTRRRNLERNTLKELKEILERADLPSTGGKHALIHRLLSSRDDGGEETQAKRQRMQERIRVFESPAPLPPESSDTRLETEPLPNLRAGPSPVPSGGNGSRTVCDAQESSEPGVLHADEHFSDVATLQPLVLDSSSHADPFPQFSFMQFHALGSEGMQDVFQG